MKILYYDCFSGISGDMNLAALIDSGVDSSYLIYELQKLNLTGYSITFTPDQRKGISGTRADVILTEESHSHEHNHNAPNHISPQKQFIYNPGNVHSHEHTQHRTYKDIRKLIEESELNDKVKQISLKIFHLIAVAEGHIHGKPIDEVHFHEVGAIDSIVDIVGAAICIEFLNPDKIICSSVQLGGGMVKCAHGTFPVPAPATLEILKGKPVKMGAVQVETTTPTGAAIVAALADEFVESPDLKIVKIAYGIGHRDNAVPNVLRVCLAEPMETAITPTPDSATMLECNIDDMNPEFYEYVMDKLFEAGADDVFFQSIFMKKNRPAVKISVLCQTNLIALMEHILLSETTTLGLRKYNVQKTMLQRSWKPIDTKWGKVNIKLGHLNNQIIKQKPEYDDCLRIAKENNISLAEVYKEIAQLISR